MERCPQCGNPRYVCQNPDSDIDFRAYDETCYAMRKKAEHEKRHEKDKDRQGVAVGIESFTHSDTALEEFRGPFYRDKSKERETLKAARPIRPRETPVGVSPQDDDS